MYPRALGIYPYSEGRAGILHQAFAQLFHVKHDWTVVQKMVVEYRLGPENFKVLSLSAIFPEHFYLLQTSAVFHVKH